MKKIFFILIFFLFLGNVFSVEITELEDLQQGNTELIARNAELTANVSALKNQIIALQADIQGLKETSLNKSDLPGIYGEINGLNRASNAQILATNLVTILFAFALMFLFKSKGVL